MLVGVKGHFKLELELIGAVVVAAAGTVTVTDELAVLVPSVKVIL